MAGIALIATSTGGIAGQFNGSVVTNGNLTVNGTFTATGIKSAAVPSGNGLVRLYCMENPESYFEDFGEGTISGGQGSAPMSPDFAALVDVNSAKIFLTEIGNLGGLYVNGVSGGSFSIASRSTSANGSFTYRIVAKRKDVQAPRLQDVPVTTGTSNFVTPRDVKTPDAPGRAAPLTTAARGSLDPTAEGSGSPLRQARSLSCVDGMTRDPSNMTTERPSPQAPRSLRFAQGTLRRMAPSRSG